MTTYSVVKKMEEIKGDYIEMSMLSVWDKSHLIRVIIPGLFLRTKKKERKEKIHLKHNLLNGFKYLFTYYLILKVGIGRTREKHNTNEKQLQIA